MSISEARQKIKTCFALIEKREVYGALLIIFVALSSFALGKLSEGNIRKTAVIVENMSAVYSAGIETSSREVRPTSPVQIAPKPAVSKVSAQSSVPASSETNQTGKYVAAKSGTRYYLPTCSGVKRIKEANKIWFETKEDALAAGFTPALNCDGI